MSERVSKKLRPKNHNVIRLPESLHIRLKKHCERRGVTMRDYVEGLIDQRIRADEEDEKDADGDV